MNFFDASRVFAKISSDFSRLFSKKHNFTKEKRRKNVSTGKTNSFKSQIHKMNNRKRAKIKSISFEAHKPQRIVSDIRFIGNFLNINYSSFSFIQLLFHLGLEKKRSS